MLSKLKSFRLQPNKKTPSNEWSKGKEKHNKDVFINKYLWEKRTPEMLEQIGCGIPCGKVNKIWVLDLDFYVKTTDKEPYDKSTCIFTQEFGEVLDYAKQHNIFCVQSPSGGFHLYFKYDPSIKQTSKKSCHIDVRNDGGYIVAPYTKIDGKQYMVVNEGEINECPAELKTFMLDKVFDHKSIKKMIAGKTSKGKQQKEKELEVDLGLYTFDFPEELLIQVIENLPDKMFNEYEEWIKFITALKTLDRQDLMFKYPKQNNPVDGDVNSDGHQLWMLGAYEGIRNHNELFCVNYILNVAQENGMTDARTLLDYFKFKDIPQMENKPNETIDRNYLGETFFQYQTEKYIVCKSDTGTGKTTSFKKYIKNNSDPFISVVSRVSLGLEQTRIFRAEGIDCVFHKEITDEMKEDCMVGWYMYEGKNIVITIDSLLKLNNWTDYQGYTIYLDEVNSLINYMICADMKTLGENRVSIYNLLKSMIYQADKVIMTDADINDITFDYVKILLNEDNRECIRYIENEYKHNQNKKAIEMFDFQELQKEVLSLDKVMICSDTKSKVNVLAKEFEKIGKEHMLYTADGYFHYKDGVKVNYKKKNGELPSLDMCEIVLFSPAITYGLDSVMKRPVYGVFTGQTISPEAQNQQLNRCRNITYFKFIFEGKKWSPYGYINYIDSYRELVETEKFGLNIKKEIHDTYTDKIINIQNDDYLRLLAKYNYREDCYKTNMFAHFIRILKRKGFNVKTYYKQTKKIDTKAQKEAILQEAFDKVMVEVEEYKQQIDLKPLPETEKEKYQYAISKVEFYNIDLTEIFENDYMNVIHYSTKIPPEDFHKFEDLVKDNHKLTEHRLYCKYFHREQDNWQNEFDGNKDFLIQKVKMFLNKLMYLNKFKLMCGIPEDKKKILMATNGIDSSKTEDMFKEYESLFRPSQRKKSKIDLTTIPDCSKTIFNMYKGLFGQDSVMSKRSRKNGQDKSVYSLKPEWIEKQEQIRKYKQDYDINQIKYEEYICSLPCELDSDSDSD